MGLEHAAVNPVGPVFDTPNQEWSSGKLSEHVATVAAKHVPYLRWW